MASFRLFTSPACDTADSDGSEMVLRQASRSQPWVTAGSPPARSRLSWSACPCVSRTKRTDVPSPSPTIAMPRKNGSGRSPADSAMTPVRNATSATAR